MNSLQIALLRAGLISPAQLREFLSKKDEAKQLQQDIAYCRRNVIKCNTSKKLKYCRG
jgi:hypothetical protein